MFSNSWYKKERPLLSMLGFGGGVGGKLVGGAAGPKALGSGGYVAEPGNLQARMIQLLLILVYNMQG